MDNETGDKKMSIGDYDVIMSNHDTFNKVVYTPLSEALRLLEERQKDPVLMAKIEKLLNGDIPEVLRNNKCGVLCRQIATPNYDARSFISITLDNNLKPVFFEYLDDKFVPDNEFKHSLGQLRIHTGIDKNGHFIEEKVRLIDFNKSNGKKLREIKTMEGEYLSDFHKKLFKLYKININKIDFIDGSEWVRNNGKIASKYYMNLFLLYVCHGILFENFFITKDKEGIFTKTILLPSIEKIINLLGVKPLIVPLSLVEIEKDIHFLSHNSIVKQLIKK